MDSRARDFILAVVLTASVGHAITFAQRGNRGAEVSIERSTVAEERNTYHVQVHNSGQEGAIATVVIGADSGLVRGWLDAIPEFADLPDGWDQKSERDRTAKRFNRWQLWLSCDSETLSPRKPRDLPCRDCGEHMDTFSIPPGETRTFRIRFKNPVVRVESMPVLVAFADGQIMAAAHGERK